MLNQANEVIGEEGFVKIRVADQIVNHGLQDGDFVAFRVSCFSPFFFSFFSSFSLTYTLMLGL